MVYRWFCLITDCDADSVRYHLEHVADYYPFGKILREYVAQGVPEKFLTTQHERDTETGLDYRGARFYDSEVGRFLSVDPLAREYAAWSTYCYTLDNPVRFVDPDGRAPDDYVFVNTKGEEIARIEDPNVRAVVIVPNKNLATFEAGQYVWSLEYKKSLGTVYRMEGVDQLYENSVNDLAEPYDKKGNLQVSDGKGNPRYDVSVEHGASTVLDAQGNVIVGNNVVAGTPYSVIIDRPSDGLGDVHSHPNEGKGAIKMDKGGFYIDTERRGPSDQDLNKSTPPKTGYYNIMIDDKDYYFYDRSNIIKIPKGKL